MSGFGWLHVSDLHAGLDRLPPLWPNVREAFLLDLERLHARSGPWDAVFFTGDIAQHGLAEEYALADSLVLEPLRAKLSALGSPSIPIYATPGNHDLIRPSRTAAVRMLTSPASYEEIATEFTKEATSEYRQTINQAFAPYMEWWKNISRTQGTSPRPGLLPGDFACSQTKNGIKIGIVGLNSAYLHLTEGNFRGRLALDHLQLHTVCENDPPKWLRQHDLHFLLSHHGPTWLSPTRLRIAMAELMPAGRFTAHLFGHMHDNALDSSSRGGGPRRREIQASSLFGLEKYGEPPIESRRHGYSAGRIEFDGDAAVFRQWPRTATRDTNGWRFHADNTNAVLLDDEGTEEEPIPSASTPLQQRPSNSTSRPESTTQADWPSEDPVLKEYCKEICERHGSISFLEAPNTEDVPDIERVRLLWLDAHEGLLRSFDDAQVWGAGLGA